ncbi:polysaccharide biosynthesis/export family protein [uncultured Algoriphagus sp.]|uniref:polysaccharide biosynthesis/export family protein n=1 Tax=uncultured Algoriphagus sp. TaxID=417365 RepID=UPI0025954852|nr:polysaccharide biosynthesis/export family protein [uncultured Algoriphagus sp.]
MRRILFLFISFSSFSCVSNEALVYFQNIENSPELVDNQLISYEIADYQLQFNDILNIEVKSSIDFINSAFSADLQGSQGMQAGIQGGGDIYYMNGYSINRKGEIELPILGIISIEGLTLDETKELIREKLLNIADDDFFIKVKLGGIRYSILGEVNSPGKFTVLQDRLTIFEALAQAGDFTSFAKRDEIIILRQYPTGTKIHRINLLDRAIITSPYYFVQTNDQIYAQPLKQREFARSENASQSILIISSVMTSLLLLVNFFTN